MHFTEQLYDIKLLAFIISIKSGNTLLKAFMFNAL